MFDIKEIVAERISILYKSAVDSFENNPELSKEYLKHIKKMRVHYRIKLPKNMKISICRKCNLLLIPGKSSTIRLASKDRMIIYRCMNCNKETKTHY